MDFNDDEPIDASQQPISGFIAGRTKMDIISRVNLPMEACKLNVMVELKGTGSPNIRPGVDIVAVLDISRSMENNGRMEQLKKAMQYVIKKLSPMHRLSIITYSNQAERLCPLRRMTKSAQVEIENKVNALSPHGGTNMESGLKMALQVLDNRKVFDGRVAAIMLMSDGNESRGTHAANVKVDKVPVYTFGVGTDYTTDVLNTIAVNSDGGTFSTVDVEGEESSTLGTAFSLCLAGLLTMVVKDLQLNITPVLEHSTIIKNVYASKYKINKPGDSETVSIGDLYDQEIRRVLVNVDLSKVDAQCGFPVLEISYSYKVPGEGEKEYEASPIFVDVSRSNNRKEDEEREEIRLEQLRLAIVDMMNAAAELADKNDIRAALQNLEEANDLLTRAGFDQDNDWIKMLKYEVNELARLMTTKKNYDTKGRHFNNSAQTSHGRQRVAARGDVEKLAAVFVTDVMEKFLQQFKSYEQKPGQKLKSFEDETTNEITANPMAAIAGPLATHLENAIQSLRIMQESLGAIKMAVENTSKK